MNRQEVLATQGQHKSLLQRLDSLRVVDGLGPVRLGQPFEFLRYKFIISIRVALVKNFSDPQIL